MLTLSCISAVSETDSQKLIRLLSRPVSHTQLVFHERHDIPTRTVLVKLVFSDIKCWGGMCTPPSCFMYVTSQNYARPGKLIILVEYNLYITKTSSYPTVTNKVWFVIGLWKQSTKWIQSMLIKHICMLCICAKIYKILHKIGMLEYKLNTIIYNNLFRIL